jgi:WD40 repeat protein
MAERRSADAPESRAAMKELQAILDEEIDRLPDKYRVPFLLCCVQGASRTEAAAALGWKEGTVAGRLARARDVLQKRLTARGVALSAAMAALALSPTSLSAGIATTLLHCTVDAALAFAAGNATAAISSQGLALAKGTLKGMLMAKVTYGAAVVAVSLALVSAGGLFAVFGGDDALHNDQSRKPMPPAIRAVDNGFDDFGDPLPAGALRRLGTTRFRQYFLHEMAFMPDGQSLVAIGSDNVIHWDMATGKPLRFIPTSGLGNRRSLGLSRDGRLVAIRPREDRLIPIVSDDQSVVVIDMATGKERFRKKLKSEFPGGVISPDESTIAIGSTEATFLIDLNTGKELAQLPGTDDLRFSPDGKWLAGMIRSDSRRKEAPGDHIILFDAKTGQEKSSIGRVDRLPVVGDYLERFDFTPDGRTVLLSWYDSGTLIYDLAKQKIAHRLDANFVAISPDSKIVAASKERTLTLTLIETGAEVRRWQVQDTIPKWARGAFSPDGKILALAFECGIQLWDPETGTRLDPYRASVHSVLRLALSDHGKSLAVVFGRHAGQFLQLFETETLREKVRLDAKPFTLEHIAFSPDGRRLAIKDWPRNGADRGPYQVRLLDVATGKEVTLERKILGRFSHWKGNDTFVVVEGENPGKAEWIVADAVSGEVRERTEIPKNIKLSIYDPSCSPAPRRMVIVSEDRYGLRVPRDDDYGKMFLAEWPNGKRIRPLVFSKADEDDFSLPREGHVWLSTDERLILTSSIDDQFGHTCTFLEAATGRERFTIEPNKPGGYVHASFSPDGRLIVLIREKYFALLDSLTFEPLKEFEPHYASCVAFSADGQLMVTSDRASVLVWDLRSTLRPRKVSAEKLTEAQLSALWNDLEKDDARIGHRAMVALARRPDETIAFLKSRLSGPPPEAKTFWRFVRELSDPDFPTRDAATSAISQMGECAGALLRESLKNPASLEAKRRLTTLVEKLTLPHSQRVRWLRSIELLERIGSHEARATLEYFRAVIDPELSADAARSLERLALAHRE